jgi:ABC-2 type transport system ATP-binding protein
MPAVVVANGVTKRWGATVALAEATFEIGPGITGLLGANGAGKTTLLSLVLGMHRPDGGTLRVLGRDPRSAGAEIRARIGYAPEHDALPPDARAHDLVRHLAEIHGLPRREAQSRASDALWEVGLGEERFRAVGTMSTGQRQRVKLAQAIAHDPRLVLLDEPTSGLDPGQRDQMLELIRRVGHDLGLVVVLSSHVLEEVDRVSDAVVILDQGRVVRSGALEELRRPQADEMVVEVDGSPADARALADHLSALGISSSSEGLRVVVAVEADDALDRLRDGLDDLALGVRRMQRRRASLEDVFLAGTPGGPGPR